jgi:hypothetical protein
MSITYHPETDRQTERLNQTLEHEFCVFSKLQSSNWSEMYRWQNKSYTNLVTSPKAISPFYAKYGDHPKTNWQTEVDARNGWSHDYVTWISSVHELCHKNLQKTYDRMGRHPTCGKNEPPKYELGDLLMPKGTTLKTRRLTKKVDNKLPGQSM